MTTTTSPTTSAAKRPKRGRPKKGGDDEVAVAFIEAEVVNRRTAGETFPHIEAALGITNADRIFRRAAAKMREQSRADAYALESARLDALHAKAWAALTDDGLDSLADRIAERMCSGDQGDTWEPSDIRAMIERAYADTLRAVPVVLGVHDRAAKLHGLNHSDRIADAQLELDAARVRMWGAAFAEALALLDVPEEDKRAVVVRWGELVQAEDSPDE